MDFRVCLACSVNTFTLWADFIYKTSLHQNDEERRIH